MVKAQRGDLAPQLVPLSYVVEEQALIAKTGRDEDCEDAIFIGPSFVAVIDGATSKTPRRWDGKTGGRVAAETLKETFQQIPPDATARQSVDLLTAAIKGLYERYHILDVTQDDPVQRAVAAFVAVSFQRREVWFVGDCQCLLNQKLILNKKEIDDITANARSAFLEAEIVEGKTIEELLQSDAGREFIFPLLAHQTRFQNNPAAGQYWFSVIDGFHVPDEGIRVEPLPNDIETIVLASDGYPYLKATLHESEQALQEVLHDDPLLFRKYRATKGMHQSNLSFDDRAYVRLQITNPGKIGIR